MSTEDKRRRLRRLVPSWSFLTCLRRPLLFHLAGKEGGRKGALGRGLVRPASESRVYLKTPNAPGQRTFSRCAAPFFLEIRQYSCEKMSCSAQKFLAAGHIGSFQIHPRIEHLEKV